jgi:hypothetical protein
MSQLQKPRPVLTFFIAFTPKRHCDSVMGILTLIIMVSKSVTTINLQPVGAR